MRNNKHNEVFFFIFHTHAHTHTHTHSANLVRQAKGLVALVEGISVEEGERHMLQGHSHLAPQTAEEKEMKMKTKKVYPSFTHAHLSEDISSDAHEIGLLPAIPPCVLDEKKKE